MSATFVRDAALALLTFLFTTLPAAAQAIDRHASLAAGYVVRVQYFGVMNGVAADVAFPAIWKLDVVTEGSWAHGSMFASDPFLYGTQPTGPYHDVGATFATALTGLRATGTTRLYPRLRFSAQVLGGVVATHLSGKNSIFNETLFGIQPGVAVEFPLFGQVNLRPQIDGIVGKLSGIIPNGRRLTVLFVMRPRS